jgi:hypothetical protein
MARVMKAVRGQALSMEATRELALVARGRHTSTACCGKAIPTGTDAWSGSRTGNRFGAGARIPTDTRIAERLQDSSAGKYSMKSVFRRSIRSGLHSSGPWDVMNSVGGEVIRFWGPFDVLARVTITAEMNRYFRADQSNANFALQSDKNF